MQLVIESALDEKIAIIKHELNVTNANAKVLVGDVTMSIDSILIKMAQLNVTNANAMNVYTHIGFDDAEEELKRMEEFRRA